MYRNVLINSERRICEMNLGFNRVLFNYREAFNGE